MAKRAVIGVVGGVGPYAGLDLVKKIFDHTKADRDQRHLSVSLLSFSERIADRTAYLTGRVKTNPAIAIAGIVAALRRTGARVAGIPCNTVHAPAIFSVLEKRLRRAKVDIRLVHMINEVARHVRLEFPHLRRVAVLSTDGTYCARVYPEALAQKGVEVMDQGPRLQELVQNAIYHPAYGIKAQSSPVSPRARAALIKAVKALKARGAQAVILGCTELPLALPERRLFGMPLIDSTGVLACALVRAAAPGQLVVSKKP